MNELQFIQNKVFEIRQQRVILDFHLAEMYEIETRALKQAVRRNIDRFPSDFMFQLEKPEFIELITNCDNLRIEFKFTPAFPFAFTEQGIAMLSSILKSPKAIQINISIMRAFVELRKYALGYAELKYRLDVFETDVNSQFSGIYSALEALEYEKKEKPRPVIGYIQPENK
jgi:hypothetical protein